MLERLRGEGALLAIPVLCTLVIGLATVNSTQVGSIQDDAWYLNTATALARGQGFVRPWTPDLMPETSLPPGLPFILAPLRWLFPGSFLPAQLLSLAAMLGVVLLAIPYYRRTVDERIAWPATLFLAVNVGLIGHSMVVMTEAVYTFCVMLIMSLCWRGHDRSGRRAIVMLAISLLTVAAYFIRSWGLVLAVALIVYYALRGRRLGALAAGLPFVVGYVLWTLRNEANGGIGGSYGIAPSTVLTFVRRFNDALGANFVTHWFHDLPQWFFTPRTVYTLDSHGMGSVALLAGAALVALIVIGYVEQVRRQVSLPEFFVLAHAGIVSIAPLNARYWIPILPFAIVYFVIGLRLVLAAARRWLTPQRASSIVAIVLVGLIGLHITRDVQDVFDPPRLRVPDVAIGPQWIAANTRQDAVVLAIKPRVSYLYAQRTTWAFPDGKGEVFDAYPDLAAGDRQERLLRVIESKQVDFVLVEPSLGEKPPFKWPDYVRQIVVPALDGEPARFRLVFSDGSGMTRVYEIVR